MIPINTVEKKWTKGFCVLTLFVFTFSTTTSNASTASPEAPASPRNIPTEIILPVKAADSLEETLKKIPEDLGVIQEIHGTRMSQSSSDKPFVVHIQDAHSNPQAQSKIYKMLKYLNRKFPNLAIGVEGARGTLHPEYFDFFPDYPETGEAVIKDLHEKGEVTGAELFAWDEYKSHRQKTSHEMTPVFGVEDMTLYRENLATYRELLFNRNEMDVALNVLRGQILKEQSKIVNPELRTFIRERERRKEGKFEAGSVKGESDFSAYLDFFTKQVKGVLQIDLLDPIEQLRFPNLVRIQLLKKAESEIDPAQSSAEWQKVLKLFRSKAQSDQEKALIQTLDLYGRKNKLLADVSQNAKQNVSSESDSLYPRRLLEKIIGFAQSKRINLNGEKNFWASFRLLVFHAEIEMPALLKEIEILENGIVANLARSEEEKSFVRQLENFSLFEKWLHIDLSREELEKILQRKNEMTELLTSFLSAPENIQTGKLLAASAQKAERFYSTARKRDQVIVQNALEFQGQASRQKKNKKALKSKRQSQIPILVLITGGFHSEGITNQLNESALGFAVISPRMNEFDGGELYQQVMADQHADLSLYFRNGNPFQSKQQAILFKQAIEIAVPLLVKGYQVPTQQVPGMIKAAMDTHPLLSQVLAVNLIGQNQQTIRFSPKASDMISPKSAAIVRELLANRDGVSLSDQGPRITFNVEVNPAGRAELKVVASSEVRLAGNRAELRAQSGALTPEQLARRDRLRPVDSRLPKSFVPASNETNPTGAEIMGARQRAELRLAETETTPFQRFVLESIRNLPATSVLSRQLVDGHVVAESRAPLPLVRAARNLGWVFAPHLAAADPRLAGALRTYVQARSSAINPSIQDMDLEAYQAVIRAFSGTELLASNAEPTNLVVLTRISDLAGGAEANSYFFIPILLGGSVQILIDRAEPAQVQELQAQFRAYSAKLRIPDKLASRLVIESQTPSTGAQRRTVEKFFALRSGARGIIGAEADVTRFGFDGKTVRAYRSEVRMDAAVVMAPSMIRELVAQILHVPQSIDAWMRTKGFDSDSISARIAVAMETFRKIAEAA